MNYGEMAAGVAGLMLLIFFGYMLVSYLVNARPVTGFGRREDYPMDPGIHKAQMGVPRAKEARSK
jgi:hypothetical protein